MLLPDHSGNFAPLEMLMVRTSRKYRRHKILFAFVFLVIILFSLRNGSVEEKTKQHEYHMFIVTVTRYSNENVGLLYNVAKELKYVESVKWIVVESVTNQSLMEDKNKMRHALSQTNIDYVHLMVDGLGAVSDPMMTIQRNTAIDWIHLNYPHSNGWIYFADLGYLYDFKTIYHKLQQNSLYGYTACVWMVTRPDTKLFNAKGIAMEWSGWVVFPGFSMVFRAIANYSTNVLRMGINNEHDLIATLLHDVNVTQDHLAILTMPKHFTSNFVVHA